MAKKNLGGGIDSILSGSKPQKKTSEPKKITKNSHSNTIRSSNMEIALNPSSESSSTTHIVPNILMGKARYISAKEGVSVKDVFNQSLAMLITAWEEKNYPITDQMLVGKRKKNITII